MDMRVIQRAVGTSILLFTLTSGAWGEDTKQQTNDAFWDSVYSKNHVLDIQINLTSENWTKMAPQGQQLGRRGPGGPPRGPPGGPPRGRRQFGGPQGPPNGPIGGGRRGPGAGGRTGGRGAGGPGRGGPPGGRPGGGGGGSEYTYVKSQIVIDGQSFAAAGLRFKGNSSYRFAARSMKRPMKIDTNRFTKGQKLYGRTKLNLSNAFLDSAFMKEKLAYELYKSAGLATPGVGWANVTLTIDGKRTPLGIYVIIEQVDQKFLARHYGKDSKDSLLMKPEVREWRYLGDDPESYSTYGIKYGEKNVQQIKRFAELLKLIENANDDVFNKEIGERVDLPQLAGYLAATSLLSNVDSYIAMPHNYYLVMTKSDGKLRLLPWDVNEAFGTFTMGASPEQLIAWRINRPWVSNRPILDRLFKSKDFQQLYRNALEKLLGEFNKEKMFPRIEAYKTAISPYIDKYQYGAGSQGLQMGIEGDATGYNRAVERQVLAIKPFITRRSASVKAQLAAESN